MSEHPGEFAADRPVTVDEAAPALSGALAVSGPRKPLVSRTSLRRALLAAGGAAAFAAIGYFGWQYWTVGRFEVSTDDAYVQADNTTIAPKISGYVAEVLVGDNEPVKAGQTLAQIDDRDFRVALDQAKADVAAASAAILTKEASIEAQRSAIEAARAAIRVDAGQLRFRGPGRQALRDPRRLRLRQRAKRRGGGVPLGRVARHDPERSGRARSSEPADRSAEGRACGSAGDAGPRPGGRAAGRAQPVLHDHRLARRRRRRRADPAGRPIRSGGRRN